MEQNPSRQWLGSIFGRACLRALTLGPIILAERAAARGCRGVADQREEPLLPPADAHMQSTRAGRSHSFPEEARRVDRDVRGRTRGCA